MPRKRMIDPEIWRDTDFATLPLMGKLLFIGIFSHADDEGRLEADPMGLKIKIFPADSQDIQEIKSALETLEKRGLVVIYEASGKKFLFIPKWFKHQSVPKPHPSDLPLPPKELIEKHPSYLTGLVQIYERFKGNAEPVQNQYSINTELIQEWFGNSIGTVQDKFGSNTDKKGKERKRNIKEKKNNINTYAQSCKNFTDSEPSSKLSSAKKSSPPLKINLNLETGEWENITEEDKKRWKEAYPACDVELELKRAAEYILANPKKKKKNYRRYIVNWLSRQQDRGGTKSRASPQRSYQPGSVLYGMED